jgi:hypothetical protein
MQQEASNASFGSRKSSSSGRYKKVAESHNVDDTLFASSAKKLNSFTSKTKEASLLMTKKPTAIQTDSIVLTAAELERLQKLSTVVDRSDLQRQRDEADKQKMAAQSKARERKEKMIAMEAVRKAKLAKSDLELEDESKSEHIVNNAERARDEQLDDVKHMNQMMLYAKCVTIRDAQLLEKQMIQKEKTDQEKAYDYMLEQERLKSLAVMEERERQKHLERLRGASVIRMQIEQREKERIREQEQLDMEREAMLRQIERLKQMEKEKEEERRRMGKEMLHEAAMANAEQIKRKEEHRHKMQEEEERIAEYIKERDRKEQERQEAMEAELKAKAEETARLRAKQERAADKQAETDALRAKRAQEDYERAWRAKERAEVEKKNQMLQEIIHSREEQRIQRELVQAEAAQMEKQQFERILAVQRTAEALEREKELRDKDRRLAHNEDIRRQIAENDEARQRSRQEFLEEGMKIRHAKQMETRRLEAIKQRKLAELQRNGVPEKYLAELRQKKTG